MIIADMKDLSPILRTLGLLDSEITTYLTALRIGPSTVIDLAAKSSLSRQATYTAIEALTERGLMSSVQRGKKSYYAAEGPEKLVSFAKRRETFVKDKVRDLENSIDELRLLQGGEKPIVRMFEGKAGIKAIIEDMRETKAEQTFEIADLDAMYKVLTTEDLEEMRQELRKLGSKVKGIYTGTSQAKTKTDDRMDLPAEYGGFGSNIGVYGNKVALVTFKGKMYSVIVESPELAATMRLLFSLAHKGKK